MSITLGSSSVADAGHAQYTGVRTVQAPTLADVEAAVRLPPTPLVESDGFALKLESLQPTGSFKVRGALAALTALEPRTHVVTASAGNHGLAVAWAAEQLGLDATIVVAETASPAKIEGIRRFPATLVVRGPDYDAAEQHALSLDGRYVSPYNDRDVIAGQGTVALELEAAETIVVPIGGGGLAAGIGIASQARLVGVVPEASPAMQEAVRGVMHVGVQPTIADGLAGNIEPGSVTIELCARRVDEIVAVGEDELAAAMRFLVRAHGVVAEGAGAAATAALLAGRIEPRGRTVALVTGRNVVPAKLAELFR
jgi:threonine dehydratase